jgi:hypothetical protein
MFSRIGELPAGTRVFVRTGSGPEEFGTDFYYGTVLNVMASRVVVKWDIGEPIPVGVMSDGYSMDYGAPSERTYEFVTFEEFDGLDLVLPFRGI